MIYEEIPVRIPGSEPYARLQCYIWSWSEEIDIDERPLILILPGGGYHLCTDREAEPVALHFMALGYHAAVLRYSVAPTLWPVSVLEVGEAFRIIRENASAWKVDPERITLMGFSAGGHLAASYGVYWDRLAEISGKSGAHLFEEQENRPEAEGKTVQSEVRCESGGLRPKGQENSLRTEKECGKPEVGKKSDGSGAEKLKTSLETEATQGICPNGLILGYPVISADPSIWHEGSFRQLLGKRFEDQRLRDQVSLEKHVTSSVPPVFIWNTKTDDTVPAANSEVFAEALRAKNVPVEYHEYPTGGHGLSLANELSDNRQHWCYWKDCQDWVDYAAEWLKRTGLGVRIS